ncbi:uncharacterized protein LOC126574173 [Anopheles aquasalis]|uniref:uncharacterized protein LOC126574173 n=1 Tax=Anopheles aquasalis TaxID=42839 RepID=UPI00215A848A|nr:uncharacterized protein LOC126574173 [Anopheles aquasalis]
MRRLGQPSSDVRGIVWRMSLTLKKLFYDFYYCNNWDPRDHWPTVVLQIMLTSVLIFNRGTLVLRQRLQCEGGVASQRVCDSNNPNRLTINQTPSLPIAARERPEMTMTPAKAS